MESVAHVESYGIVDSLSDFFLYLKVIVTEIITSNTSIILSILGWEAWIKSITCQNSKCNITKLLLEQILQIG